jgi:branched-chain amino acid transport system ATP-binding protein
MMARTDNPTPRSSEERTVLEVDSVRKQFGGLVALEDVSFDVSRGEVLGLIGPNGAGKTTLFNVVNGFLDPDAGSVTLDGQDVTDADPHERAESGMARTFQLLNPFEEMTVLENVMVGAFQATRSRSTAEETARDILDQVNLGGVAGVESADITHYQKRRMELARALATDPELLLLDEIMAGLNDEEITKMLGIIESVNDSGVSIVVIEHVMDAIMSVSDRILVLDKGTVIGNGTPESISRNEQVIDAYLGTGWRENGGDA